jgi:hypothetical protein
MSSDKKNSLCPGGYIMTVLVDEMTRIMEAVPFLWSPLFPVY